MNNSQARARKRRFILLTIGLIFITPWIWYLLFKSGLRPYEFHFVVIGLVALLIGVLYTKMKGNLWAMLILLLVVPPMAQDLESYILFEIHYANNDVHIMPSNFMPEGEMYRDFDSYYEFSYGYDSESFSYRTIQHLKNAFVWLIVPLSFIFFNWIRTKPTYPSDIIDQE